jgi:hypothetical protein
LFNLSTLRTQTCFRTPDGYLYGWEGCGDQDGCCFGSCTHVWNYEQATPFLFGDLARGMREIEFGHATEQNGKMSFRVNLPLAFPSTNIAAAGWADGMHHETLPRVEAVWMTRVAALVMAACAQSLEFCWIEGGWDATATA